MRARCRGQAFREELLEDVAPPSPPGTVMSSEESGYGGRRKIDAVYAAQVVACHGTRLRRDSRTMAQTLAALCKAQPVPVPRRAFQEAWPAAATICQTRFGRGQSPNQAVEERGKRDADEDEQAECLPAFTGLVAAEPRRNGAAASSAGSQRGERFVDDSQRRNDQWLRPGPSEARHRMAMATTLPGT